MEVWGASTPAVHKTVGEGEVGSEEVRPQEPPVMDVQRTADLS